MSSLRKIVGWLVLRAYLFGYIKGDYMQEPYM